MRKVTQRNRQIRKMRKRLIDLADHLGDAKVSPPLPEHLKRWIQSEIRNLYR